MARVVARRLSFAHSAGLTIFEDVDLTLDPGFWAIVGANGAGKTTFARLVAGTLRPTRGAIEIAPDDAAVVLCAQTVDELPAEAIVLAERWDGEALRLRDTLALEPEDLERWPTLSPGERKRWQIGAALAASPDVLVLDEPENHLDARARRALVRALSSFRGVGLLVTHDRELSRALTAKTLRVHGLGIRAYHLGYDEARAVWEGERKRADDERDAWKRVVAKRARALDDAQRTRASAERAQSLRHVDKNDHDARGMLAKTMASWAEARAGRTVAVRREELEREKAREPEVERRRELGRSIFVAFEKAPQRHLAHLEAEVLHAGDASVLRDVRATFSRDDRVRLAGDNGAGKSTLLRALAARATSASLVVVPQEIGEAARLALLASVKETPGVERGRILSLVAALGADPDRILASHSPSPGEARKLALADALGRLVHGVILDEPTNDLDLPSIERLEDALAAYPGAILLVSHDDRLAAALTTRTWTVRDGRLHV